MFTGLVEALGEVTSAVRRGSELHIVVATCFEGLALGESISVNGTCLTVDALPSPKAFSAFLSRETLDRTTLGAIRAGARVNLERALLPTTRMGGHVVTGHVDGVGTLRSVRTVESAREIEVDHEPTLAPFIAEKGSIAIEGVSLTVNRVTDSAFSVLVIPHTQNATTFGSLRAGDKVNLEVDVLARYAARILETTQHGKNRDSWAQRLLENS